MVVTGCILFSRHLPHFRFLKYLRAWVLERSTNHLHYIDIVTRVSTVTIMFKFTMLLESYRIFAVIVKFSLYPLQADIIAPTHNLIIMNKNRHRSCTLSARLDFGQFCAYHLSCPVHDIRVWRSIVSVLSLPFAIS